MSGQKIPRLQDLIGICQRLYPPLWAEEWDNPGLQVGDPQAHVHRVLVALDATADTLAEAQQRQCQLLFTHHPLLFKPLSRLVPQDPDGALVWNAVHNSIAIFTAHTNLDRAPQGLNDALSAALNLEQVQVLEAGASGQLVKLVVFVPQDYTDQVSDALFQGGAGHIGAYDQCSFRTQGTGTFCPGEGTQPFAGTVGQRQQEPEMRVETVVPKERLQRVLKKLQQAHPYEEVAYDLLPMENPRPQVGLGRCGYLPEPMPLKELSQQVAQALHASSLRYVGEPQMAIKKVAVCGGSGMSLAKTAKQQGAQVLVTGDVKYHEAQAAQALGLAVIDAGHFATEALFRPWVSQQLAQACAAAGWQVEVLPASREQDLFHHI